MLIFSRKKIVTTFSCVIMAFVLCLFASGCGRNKVPDFPSKERAELLLEMLALLDRHDYEDVLPKIERYRVLAPANTFMNDFEYIMHSNMYIADAYQAVLDDDFLKAKKILDDYVTRFGDTSTPVNEALKEIALLVQANTLVKAVKSSVFSDDIREAALDLKSFADANQSVFPHLSEYCEQSIEYADLLSEKEHERALTSVFQDAVIAMENGRIDEAMALCCLLEHEPGQYADSCVRYLVESGLFDR